MIFVVLLSKDAIRQKLWKRCHNKKKWCNKKHKRYDEHNNANDNKLCKDVTLLKRQRDKNNVKFSA